LVNNQAYTNSFTFFIPYTDECNKDSKKMPTNSSHWQISRRGISLYWIFYYYHHIDVHISDFKLHLLAQGIIIMKWLTWKFTDWYLITIWCSIEGSVHGLWVCLVSSTYSSHGFNDFVPFKRSNQLFFSFVCFCAVQ